MNLQFFLIDNMLFVEDISQRIVLFSVFFSFDFKLCLHYLETNHEVYNASFVVLME